MLLPLHLLLATVAVASPIEKRSVAGTAVVHLGNNTGVPQHLASGFIYGIPDTPNQIPDHFYTDIDFKYARAGGAQVLAPGRGWIWGFTEYKNRFASALSNYKTARKYNAQFIFLIHDLWGADGTENSTAPFPGDNGDWTSWDNFLTQWISDMKTNGATTGLVIDIWNEPDLTAFWKRSQSQWIQMWGRTYHRLRSDFAQVSITGPSLAGAPGASNTWWTSWSSFIASNNSIPDQYSWHMEGGGGDMLSSVVVLNTLRATNKLPSKTININEYATLAEQVPCGAAWWISQLERVNAFGLRGNWLSTTSLHDFMAGLLGKPGAGTSSYNPTGTGYWPAAEFQVYKYYAQNMTGSRRATSTTADLHGDVYATVSDSQHTVRLLAGARITTGSWGIVVDDLSAVGLPQSGVLSVTAYAFKGSSNHFQEFDAPVSLGVTRYTYSGNSVTLPINQADAFTAFAFEFSTRA
ncbi:glycoside hydrolase superfamily [Xylogone sp. PMI_703]|nr:glycoside hydrolase superfamily [Xylogone sp. PMI_703]